MTVDAFILLILVGAGVFVSIVIMVSLFFCGAVLGRMK